MEACFFANILQILVGGCLASHIVMNCLTMSEDGSNLALREEDEPLGCFVLYQVLAVIRVISASPQMAILLWPSAVIFRLGNKKALTAPGAWRDSQRLVLSWKVYPMMPSTAEIAWFIASMSRKWFEVLVGGLQVHKARKLQ